MSETSGLKIKATSHSDVEALSVLLQDAIFATEDLAWLRSESECVLVVNRFCWEKLPSFPEGQIPKPPYERRHSALRIGNIETLQTRNLDLATRGVFFAFLSCSLVDTANTKTLSFKFSGNSELSLGLRANWTATLSDLGEPWPTENFPKHEQAPQQESDAQVKP